MPREAAAASWRLNRPSYRKSKSRTNGFYINLLCLKRRESTVMINSLSAILYNDQKTKVLAAELTAGQLRYTSSFDRLTTATTKVYLILLTRSGSD